jgi:hypothetical protein
MRGQRTTMAHRAAPPREHRTCRVTVSRASPKAFEASTRSRRDLTAARGYFMFQFGARAARERSDNPGPPFSREFRGATSDKCHEKLFLMHEKLFLIDKKLFLHDKKLHLVDGKLFLIDEKLFLHDKKRNLIDEKLFLLDKKLHSIEQKRFLIDQKPRRR